MIFAFFLLAVIIILGLLDLKTQRSDFSTYEDKVIGHASILFDSQENVVSLLSHAQETGNLAEIEMNEVNEFHQLVSDAYTFVVISPEWVIPTVGSLIKIDYLTINFNCLSSAECYYRHTGERTFWFSSYRIQEFPSPPELDYFDVCLSLFLVTIFSLALIGRVYFLLRGPSLV